MELRAAIEAFARHLTVDRGFSEHTVRAYRGDLSGLADFVEQRALATPDAVETDALDAVDVRELDLETLRDWLWPASRDTLPPFADSPAGWS